MPVIDSTTSANFLVLSVKYLRHVTSENGLELGSDMAEAVAEVPTLKNITELKTFLGLVAFYARFLPHLSEVLYPLYQLLERTVPGNGHYSVNMR